MDNHVVITGGTGLVGSNLTKKLLQKGYQVSIYSRTENKDSNPPQYFWSPSTKEIDTTPLATADAVIHLAGAGVFDEAWTDSRKEVILKSRTESSRLLSEHVPLFDNIKTVIGASAIGYYGKDTGDKLIEEDHDPGDDFLADVTVKWEEAEKEIDSDTRLAQVRIGIVLASEGGALPQLVQPIKLYAGAPLGSGDQYMSWIHIDDLTDIFIHLLENHELKGVYNGVAPNPVTNKEITKKAAKVLGKPLFLPNVPGFVLKTMLGERAEVLLGGQKVSSQKIQKTGFKFKFSNVEEALKDLL
ncbi:TIGR01777 family oxidoreductase [Mangrovivirga sp. M17]|uniref:TIGR01777 family oxidoreductase n=1 Tax=Mangrovivirga halotolerans TaxID=2993936 RepID=A0ABT3RXU9_9BACT|nr:TIGR01777 family oxidoreductase [Mangrovivirga halotolerans]MCX2745960.1 TIGR01777 family oxidoreductase [Mangrovivirga halotolerans]